MKSLSHPVLIIILLELGGVVGALQHSQQPLLPLRQHQEQKSVSGFTRHTHPPPKHTFLSVFSFNVEQRITQIHVLPCPSAPGRWSSSSAFPNRRPRSKSTWALSTKHATPHLRNLIGFLHACANVQNKVILFYFRACVERKVSLQSD